MEPLVIALTVVVIAALSLVQRHQRATRRPHAPGRTCGPRTGGAPYPGDYAGKVDVRYAPSPDGKPDPGEIVWTWVPFQEDHSRGKDRPVLLIGRDGHWLLGIQLSSRSQDSEDAPGARQPRRWISIGAGPWDARRRPSIVRLDRIIRVDPDAVRREGAVLNRRKFDEVARSLSSLHHW